MANPIASEIVDESVVSVSSRLPVERRSLGAVYTPDTLAEWAAGLLKEISGPVIRRVLDPACGDGALFAAVEQKLPEVQTFIGVDVSETATKEVRRRFGVKAHTLTTDALYIHSSSMPLADAVIMNPPWGADLAQGSAELRRLGYELAVGQYDSWDLFVEWSIKSVLPGTRVVAILPDAIFLPEHSGTRKLLLERTRLDLVARLGEGWFEGVFRGVAVIAYTVGVPTEGRIRTVRLAHDARKRVLAGESDLATEVNMVEMTANQAAWYQSQDFAFTLDSADLSTDAIRVVEGSGGPWVEWVTSGRGVEVGKSGAMLRCELCGFHRQPTRVASPTACLKCKSVNSLTPTHIVQKSRPADPETFWAPLIVGEDVGRHQASPSRWLKLGLDGVQYKDLTVYQPPKLLVRKTGLGINAAVDSSSSLTTQVVYHYLARETAPTFFLDYLSGVLCSKVLLAVHLSRTGETEWRSHPYVTPRVLSTLPVPTPAPGTEEWALAQEIADQARQVRSSFGVERLHAEARVELAVQSLFGLDAEAIAWVETVLARTQELQAFAHLRDDKRHIPRTDRAA